MSQDKTTEENFPPRNQTEAELKSLQGFQQYIDKKVAAKPYADKIRCDVMYYAMQTTMETIRNCIIEILTGCANNERESQKFGEIKVEYGRLYARWNMLKQFIGLWFGIDPPCISKGYLEVKPDVYEFGVPICKEDYEFFTKDEEGNPLLTNAMQKRLILESCPGAIKLKADTIQKHEEDSRAKDKEFNNWLDERGLNADGDKGAGIMAKLADLSTEELKEMQRIAQSESSLD